MNEISELIDAAARAAVEHDEFTLSDMVTCFGSYQRPDGLYSVNEKIIEMYFPKEEDAKAIAAAQNRVIHVGDKIIKMEPNLFPVDERPRSAFVRFNYLIETQVNGSHPVAARKKIYKAVMAKNIY